MASISPWRRPWLTSQTPVSLAEKPVFRFSRKSLTRMTGHCEEVKNGREAGPIDFKPRYALARKSGQNR
jgi:hypothetical protein